MRFTECFLLLLILLTGQLFATTPDPSFVVVVPTYNNIKYWQRNIESISQQQNVRYRIVIIDDCSTDGTGEALDKWLSENQSTAYRIDIYHNTERRGACSNKYRAIHSCKPSEIVAIVDGDDDLVKNNVLSQVQKRYEKGAWLTYGQFVSWPKKIVGGSRPIDTSRGLREQDWRFGHLRTFYAGLYHRIPLADLLYEYGRFYPMTSDVAEMLPMVEMAGEHAVFIPRILYNYNVENQNNDNKISTYLQDDCYHHVMARTPQNAFNLDLDASEPDTCDQLMLQRTGINYLMCTDWDCPHGIGEYISPLDSSINYRAVYRRNIPQAVLASSVVYDVTSSPVSNKSELPKEQLILLRINRDTST